MVYVSSTLASLPTIPLSSSDEAGADQLYQRIQSDYDDRWQESLEQETNGHYTHTWAVHIPNGDENNTANAVAKDHGFVNTGKVSAICSPS